MLTDLTIIFLGLFILFFCYTILSHFFIKVPYVPTPLKMVREMVDLAELKPQQTVLDLGAGDGRLLIVAKKREQSITAIGVEYILAVWLLGKCTIWWSKQQIEWRWGDAFKTDLREADVIFLYLFPNLMVQLNKKFEQELKPGTRIISHSFVLPGRTPIAEKKVKTYMGTTTVRVYEW